MRITAITWLTTALLLTRSHGGERSSKQLFYTTYLYPSSSSSGSSLGSSGANTGVISNSNGFLSPQLSISPFQSFWSSLGDHKGRQSGSLIPVTNNENEAYQQQLRQQQVLWSPSLPLGTSPFISAPIHQQLLQPQSNQYQHHSHSGLTTTGGSSSNNNIAPSSHPASKNVKHVSPSSSPLSSNAHFILQSSQQIGPEYQISPTSSPSVAPSSSLPLIGYVNVPLNPTYNVWNPYGSTQTSATALQSGLLSPTAPNKQWNLQLKSYEQIQNELLANSIIPTSLHQKETPAFQRGHIEASPPGGIPNSGFVRGQIEAKPGLQEFHQVVAGIRNSGENSIRQQQIYQVPVSFNRGAVEHRYPEPEQVHATTYDTPTKNVLCYYSSWAFDRKGEGKFIPENADPTLCTHIIYAFAVLDKSKFAIKESDPTTDNKKCKEN